MGKKNLTKTNEQKDMLESFFLHSKSYWEREDLLKVSRAVGLTRQQVYKWLWDRKRSLRVKVKLENENKTYKMPKVEFKAILYRTFKIRIPVNKQQASAFKVHNSISPWAMTVLKVEGWQLVRDADQSTRPFRRRTMHYCFDYPLVKKEDDGENPIKPCRNVKYSLSRMNAFLGILSLLNHSKEK